MAFSLAGLIGACIGFILGLVDYKAVGGILEAKMRERIRPADQAGRESLEGRIRLVRRALFVTTVIGFPIVGYLFGATLGTN